MRTLIAALTFATATTLGSTAYAVPASPDLSAASPNISAASPVHVYYTGDHYASFCEVDEDS